MTKNKYITIAINIIFLIMALFFVLDSFGILEIRGDFFKSFIHFGTLLSSLFILILNLVIYNKKTWNVVITFLTLAVLTSFSITVSQRGFIGYLQSTNSWYTQTILYKNGHVSFKQIEFQMQDIGAKGYNKRYVHVLYITNWFMITDRVDPNKTLGAEWLKVDENINELNIVY